MCVVTLKIIGHQDNYLLSEGTTRTKSLNNQTNTAKDMRALNLSIAGKQAVINFQNEDVNCFEYSRVGSHFYLK